METKNQDYEKKIEDLESSIAKAMYPLSVFFVLNCTMLIMLFILYGSMVSRRFKRSSFMAKYAFPFIFSLIFSYNNRAQFWVNQGMTDFQNAQFAMNNTLLQMKNDIDGIYYPIRDSCNKFLDPEEGCVYTGALYYQTLVEMGDENESITVNISSEGVNIKSFTSIVGYRDLYCTGSKETDSCNSACPEVDGEIISNSVYGLFYG